MFDWCVIKRATRYSTRFAKQVARFKDLTDIALYLPGSDSSHKIVETTRMGRGTVGIEVSRVFNPTYS